MKTKKIRKIIMLIGLVFMMTSCKDPAQVVHESSCGFIITGVKINNKKSDVKQARGKYLYFTKDMTGIVKIYSNSNFQIGDTLYFDTIKP